ncbi:NUDIX domain-containing protein [Leptobacterium flavescens]|uniref:NUDIX domain-containing protein n=1 Tax=Leptobacterium flavescens TaxID=472055 RepID=A0A6P0UV36_9FLAO|nr:NUDIX domain-containing protein [Leptobacterium flavescens]NER14266.1 NUDIX domain-containing protein [Leptobacterium flavescens]
MVRQNIKIAVDAVVFGYKDRNLNVLLIKRDVAPYRNYWALPGGLVLNEESLEQAVERELREETNVTIDYLEQLYSFGEPGRDPRNRVVSVAYFALVKPEHHSIKADTDANDVAWFSVKELPELAFDHLKILRMAKDRLKNKLSYEPIGFDLLANKFLFSDLEKLYTTILEKDIDRRNFRKKILSLDILEELDEKVSEGRGRPANLFKFNQKQYAKLKKDNFLFDIK